MRATIITGAALLALAACNRGTPEQSGGTPSGGAPQGAPQMTITTPQGTTEIRSGGGAAAGLPQGIPPYPGAETAGDVQISGASAEGQGAIHGFRTADAPSAVIDFYASAAERSGFHIANRMNLGATTAALTAQRGQETVNVAATRADGATQVQIIVAQGR